MESFMQLAAGLACLGFGGLCLAGVVFLFSLALKTLGVGLRDRQREWQMTMEKERQERAKQERMIAGRILGGENGRL